MHRFASLTLAMIMLLALTAGCSNPADDAPDAAVSEPAAVETPAGGGTAFALTRAAGRHMKKTGGSVVLMSSCAASVGLPNHEVIAAAKAAVEGLVRSAAATYASAGLRFNAVAPGLVDTPLAARITGNDAALKASTAMHPLGRIGRARDIAEAIGFLLDDSSGWTTGQIFGVDGGLSRLKTR